MRPCNINVSCMFCVFYLFHVVLYIQDSQWPRHHMCTFRAVGTNVNSIFACVFYLFHAVLYIQDSQWPRDSVL